MYKIHRFLIPGKSTVDDVKQIIKDNPELKEYLAKINNNSNRSRYKRSIKKKFGPDIANLLFEIRPMGRPRYTGVFKRLSESTRQLIRETLKIDNLSEVQWNPVISGLIADNIVKKYDNDTSALIALRNFRYELIDILKLDRRDAKNNPIIALTYRAGISILNNQFITKCTMVNMSEKNNRTQKRNDSTIDKCRITR